jgi:hypothetical protein
MSLRTNVVRATAAAALAGAALVLATAPASAASDAKYVDTSASGTCDTATGEWIVDWQVTNLSAGAATLTNVVFAPTAGTLPGTVAGKGTVHATTRVPGNGTMGSLNYTATWSDGSAQPASWYFKPFTPCTKAAPTAKAPAGWSVTDANGTYRGSVTADPHLSNVCDTLADGVTVSAEAKLSDGSTVKRIAPLGGCTPFQPFNGATITAVRGFANDFANAWHPVA